MTYPINRSPQDIRTADTSRFVSPSGSAAILMRTFSRIVRQWQIRRRDRRHLLELDDRMLRDIGFTRADLYRETSKPFWRR